MLSKEGVSTRVVDLVSVKPIDRDLIVRLCRGNRCNCCC